MDKNNKYSQMQSRQYEGEASTWTIDNRDPVVGSFDRHNTWKDYDDFLFKGIITDNLIALDFGCGPGRNIVKFSNQFSRVDGVDISSKNLENAKIWCEYNNVKTPNLYKTNGTDLEQIPDFTYDVVFSTICMQHICVHEIRFSLLKEFYRVLNTGGSVCIQMGFGTNHSNTVGYFENNYDAPGTNSACDTRVESPDDLKLDLEKIGFTNFEYDIRPVGPGDAHTNWIFFRAKK